MENIKKRKIAICLVVGILTLLYCIHWLGCHLTSAFFFSSLDLRLKIIFDIRSDAHVSPFIARLFHNKITQGSVDIFNAYVQFWDIRFLLFSLSPLTFFGLLSWIYYVIKKEITLFMYEKVLAVWVLGIPVALLLGLGKNIFVTLIVFTFPLTLLSIRGLFSFITHTTYSFLYIGIFVVLSLWYLFIVMPLIVDFCHL